MQQPDTSPFVSAHVEHDATSGALDHAHRGAELLAAVAASGTEHVSGEAFGVDPNQDVFSPVVVDASGDQGDVFDSVDEAAVAMCGEFPELGGHPGYGDFLYEGFTAASVFDQLLYGDQGEIVAITEFT